MANLNHHNRVGGLGVLQSPLTSEARVRIPSTPSMLFHDSLGSFDGYRNRNEQKLENKRNTTGNFKKLFYVRVGRKLSSQLASYLFKMLAKSDANTFCTNVLYLMSFLLQWDPIIIIKQNVLTTSGRNDTWMDYIFGITKLGQRAHSNVPRQSFSLIKCKLKSAAVMSTDGSFRCCHVNWWNVTLLNGS